MGLRVRGNKGRVLRGKRGERWSLKVNLGVIGGLILRVRRGVETEGKGKMRGKQIEHSPVT